MNTNDGRIVTPSTMFVAGEGFVIMSYVTGLTLMLYCLCTRHDNTSAIRLITRNVWSFAKNAMPYAINTLLCWYLSLMFTKIMASSGSVMGFTSEHYIVSKVALNFAAFIAKYYIYKVQSITVKITLFVSYLILIATSEAMCNKTSDQMTSNNAAVILLSWLTVLILVAPINAFQQLSLSTSLSWRKCSLVYGLTTGMCQYWYRTVVGKDAAPAFDAFLLVLVIHVQLVCLCITYFTEGQRMLRNIAGEGVYNPMADSLEMYSTVDSITQQMTAYVNCTSTA